MKINWQTISKQTFLNEYWQKKPIILKNAVMDFEDPIDANELAGLAMEEFIDSRLISNINNQWKVEHGPFGNYDHLTESHWSLLVQGVDNWFEEVNELKQLVDFLPHWRIDDVMISYSTKGAGVGAHLDQYDVFIIQGQGQRRWQAGEVNTELKQQETVADLLQLDRFEPLIDQVLEAGDIIYIPPFSPHKGETVKNCLNYSIGLRAPSAQELLSEFADYMIDNELGNKRYNDSIISNSNLSNTTASSMLTQTEVKQLKTMLIEAVEQGDEFELFINQKLTKATRELNLNDASYLSLEEIQDQLEQTDAILVKTLGIKTSILQKPNGLVFFCNGERFNFNSQQLEFITLLNSEEEIMVPQLKTMANWLENNQFITTLVSHGYWYIELKNGLQDENC